MLQVEPPKDLHAWVVEQTGVAPESAEELLNQTKRWLQLLMCEDAKLILTLQRAVLRNANVSLNILPEPAKVADTDSDDDAEAPPKNSLESEKPKAAEDLDTCPATGCAMCSA